MDKSDQPRPCAWVMDMAAGVATVQPRGEAPATGTDRWNRTGTTLVLSCGTRIEWLSLPCSLDSSYPT